jgi:hypothetical protein
MKRDSMVCCNDKIVFKNKLNVSKMYRIDNPNS